MSRLWEALTPASGNEAPWSNFVTTAQTGDEASLPANIPWPPHEPNTPLPMRHEIPLAPGIRAPGRSQGSGLNNASPSLDETNDKDGVLEPEESIWKATEEGSAYVEIGPENEILVSNGVSVPTFRAHFNLMVGGTDPVHTNPTPSPTAPPLAAQLAQQESPIPTAHSPDSKGSIAPPVIRGILERLTHHAMGGLAPWLFLSPGTAPSGLPPMDLKVVMERIIDSIARQHGPVACLEMDEAMDGGLHAPGPGWQDLLWGRVELESILVAGRNPLVTRIPRGDDFHPEGTWFATRSIHGVAQEIRKRFGLVVVASQSSQTDAIARFWLAQCQGWTWVTSVYAWETTPMEAEARLHTKGLPPWIGCVLVDGVGAAA